MSLKFKIPIVPMGQARARAARRGNHIHMYSSPKSVEYKESLQHYLINQLPEGFKIPDIDVDIMVFAAFCMPMLRSWSQKKRGKHLDKPHTKKPDIDNLVKALFDAMNGIVWKDDSQVACLNVSKHYCADPGIYLTIHFHYEKRKEEVDE